jgi:phosphoglycolate phosphatase
MTLRAPEAILFDWDGTIVDTWPVVHRAVNITLEKMGREPWSEAEAHARIGPPARQLFTGLFGEDRWREADAIYIKAYADSIAGHLRPHAGAEDVLRAVADRRIYSAVASTKRGPLLREEAAFLGFERYFSRLIGAGDAPRDKPDAEVVSFSLKGSGINPGPAVWFYGDSATDVVCARNAGCAALLVEIKPLPDEVLSQNPPDMRFFSHEEFLRYFKSRV